MKFFRSLLIFVLLTSFIPTVVADHEIYFFYSETCPHCIAEKAFLENIEESCSDHDVKINYLLSTENREKWEEMASEYGVKVGPVPQTYIGDRAFIGFSEEEGELEFSPIYNAYIGYSNQLLQAIDDLEGDPNHIQNGTCNCENCSQKYISENPEVSFDQYILFFVLILFGSSAIFFRKKLKNMNKGILGFLILVAIIILFILFTSTSDVAIKNFAEGLPFPIFVFIVALADGFNPCAFTVLIILLSLLTYTKKKSDMLIIGMTFIVTSIVMYFIFIMVMIVMGSWAMEKYSSVIMIILGSVILIAGLINIKDYFNFNKGISLSISDKDKKKFTIKARNIINKLKESKNMKTLIAAIFGTIVLGIFVNLIELGCTAILPVIYMTSLINSFGSDVGAMHILWTLFYSVVYVIPLLAILLNFIFYFKSSRLTQKQGRNLKLFSGLIMVLFGLIMIFFPGVLVFG